MCGGSAKLGSPPPGGMVKLGKTRTMDLPAAMSAFVSRCRRGRAYVCGAYVCDFFGGAGVTLNTTIQTRAETKRHREGNTSALELGGTQEVTPCVLGAGHLHWLADRKSTRLNSSHSSISYAV